MSFLNPRKTELLPCPPKTSRAIKGEALHSISLGSEVLAFKDNGNYYPFDKTTPSPRVLLKRLREKTVNRGETKTKSKKKPKLTFTSKHPMTGKTTYSLAVCPRTKAITQTNLKSGFVRDVGIVQSFKLSPPFQPLKTFERTSTFSIFPLGDLKASLEEAKLGSAPPLLIQAVFCKYLSKASKSLFKIKDCVEPSELDRVKGEICLALHGTTQNAARRIIKNGFDKAYFGNRGAAHGKGIYLTSCVSTAHRYGTDVLLVAFHTKARPKPHFFSHGPRSFDSVVVSSPTHVLPLMWLTC